MLFCIQTGIPIFCWFNYTTFEKGSKYAICSELSDYCKIDNFLIYYLIIFVFFSNFLRYVTCFWKCFMKIPNYMKRDFTLFLKLCNNFNYAPPFCAFFVQSARSQIIICAPARNVLKIQISLRSFPLKISCDKISFIMLLRSRLYFIFSSACFHT